MVRLSGGLNVKRIMYKYYQLLMLRNHIRWYLCDAFKDGWHILLESMQNDFDSLWWGLFERMRRIL